MRLTRALLLAVAFVFLPSVFFSGCAKRSTVPPDAVYRDPAAPIEKRVDDLLSRLTLRDKIDLLSYNKGHRPGLDRLGVPLLDLNDGPLGIGGHPATCFPSGVSFAATWNPELIRQVGEAIGEEAKAYGIDVVLGPCVGIHRLPIAGRNFESYSEDPYLSAVMATAWITGLQSKGVAACVKHYICNDQEFERNLVNVVVDERTLREIYMPPFKAAVKQAGVLAVMSAYNRVNGHYMAENRQLLTDVLKGEWGFEGFVVSDYGGTYSTVPSALAGLDMEMPSPPVYFGDSLLVAVKKGLVPESVVNDKARRILRVMFKLGLFDKQPREGAADTPEHRALARKVAEQSIVLLKNEGNLLPLDPRRIHKIAVLGPKAAQASLGGGGSSETQPTYSVSLLEALRKRLPASVQISYCKGVEFRYEMPVVPGRYLRTPDGQPGLQAEYYRGMFLHGQPVVTRVDTALNFDWGKGSPAPGVPADRFSARWRGKLVAPGTGLYRLGIFSNDGSKLYVNGKLFVNNWGNHHGLLKSRVIRFRQGDTLDIQVTYYELGNKATVKLEWEPLHEEPIDPRAVELARDADVALVCVGLTKEHEAEGWDRESMDLPGGQARLISEVASVNPRTVVILTAGSPVTMVPWVDQVAAVLDAFYPGQEEGNVLYDILFGRVNPSGKLPDTFPRRYSDNPTRPYYPSDNDELVYGEGIFVGYRHYEARGIEPLFPFGFGLSYTSFAYRNLRLSKANLAAGDTLWATFEVSNTGRKAGDEIAQLYVRDPVASVPREPKALKGFRRVHLEPGETRTVRLPVTVADLAFYDPGKHRWIAEAGKFEILVGASSSDIRLRAAFRLRESVEL